VKRVWLTVREVATHLGLAATSVYAMCEARQIAHIRVGTGRGSIRISAEALEAYLAAVTVAPEPTRRR
jgi:excisionase family DNA binding protein